MFGGLRYFGLKGTKLNIAIGVLAGLDFLCVDMNAAFYVKTLLIKSSQGSLDMIKV